MNVCVYCSSSNVIDKRYFEVAAETGRLLAERGDALVYGGGQVGLMGALARAVHAHGGGVCGVIPEALKAREGVAYDLADELLITDTMADRKAMMYRRADAFMVLPGGFGTVEEFLEVLTLKQLGYHSRPIVLVNTAGYFQPLLDLFEHFYEQGFAHPRYRALCFVADDPLAAFEYVDSYEHVTLDDKWTT